MAQGGGGPIPEDELAHRVFFEKALATAAEWTRFADPKVLGIFVFLGLGMGDLVKVAGKLWEAHSKDNLGGWVATGGFGVACGCALLAVAFASLALFPQLRPGGRSGKGGEPSLFFFAHIAQYKSANEYRQAVLQETTDGLRDDIAAQVWAVAKVASDKHRAAQRAYVCAIFFLAAWASARIALSFL